MARFFWGGQECKSFLFLIIKKNHPIFIPVLGNMLVKQAQRSKIDVISALSEQFLADALATNTAVKAIYVTRAVISAIIEK